MSRCSLSGCSMTLSRILCPLTMKRIVCLKLVCQKSALSSIVVHGSGVGDAKYSRFTAFYRLRLQSTSVCQTPIIQIEERHLTHFVSTHFLHGRIVNAGFSNSKKTQLNTKFKNAKSHQKMQQRCERKMCKRGDGIPPQVLVLTRKSQMNPFF